MAKRDFYNMTDYVRENLCTFEAAPFCEVDSMVLSWISYLEFQKNKDIEKTKKGVGLADIYHLEEFDELFSEVWSKEETLEMLTLMLASPRFRDLRLSYYVEERTSANTAPTFDVTPEVSIRNDGTGKGNLLVKIYAAKDDDVVHHYTVKVKNLSNDSVKEYKYLTDFYMVGDLSRMQTEVQYTITGLPAGKDFEITVTAVDSWGTESDPVTVKVSTNF